LLKRQIIIGDIHGCMEELNLLLRKVQYNNANDELFFVGDLINKGPDSLKVLEFAKHHNVRLVLGNHELGLIRNYQQNSTSKYFQILSKQLGDQLEFWVNWLQMKPRYIEEENFILVHAGLVPHQKLSQTDERFLTSIRTWDGEGKDIKSNAHPAWFDLYTHKKLVVFGHWAQRGLVNKSNVIGLDTGCVYGNKLTALLLPERRLEHVKALKHYCPIYLGIFTHRATRKHI